MSGEFPWLTLRAVGELRAAFRAIDGDGSGEISKVSRPAP